MDAVEGWKDNVITAGELRVRLEGVPDGMPVIVAKDAEGNGYSPLCWVEVTGYVYEPDSTWSGEVRSTDDPDYEPDDRDEKIVLLGPVN